jgi:hypothetical protein
MHHELLDSYAFDVVGICCDHRWVWAKLGSKMIRRSKWRAPKSNRGWKITSSSSEYHNDLVKALPSENHQTLSTLTKAVVDVAEKYGNAAPKTVEQDSDEVTNLRSQRKHTTSEHERKELSLKHY